MRRTGQGYIRVIDFVFYNEKKIRLAVLAAREDVPYAGKSGSGVGDPTASKAIRNATPLRSVMVGGEKLEWPEDWLRVIDATRAWCELDNEKQIVLNDMYEGVDYRHTCATLNISFTTLHRFRQEIRNHAALCAANLNLIRFV